jgi:hypothetical protein
VGIRHALGLGNGAGASERRPPRFAGIILLDVAYTTAYQDALRAAVQFNERQETAFEAQHPEAP